MILPLFRRKRRDDSIERLYGAIVAQARQPAFYASLQVPDTVDGRLDMIVLHAVLVLERLDREGEATRGIGQALFDRFCQDMDDNLREMGVGDLAVPKQMQRIAGVFYGRAKAYQAALLAREPAALVETLRRNIYGEDPSAAPHARGVADYVQAAVAHLDRQDAAALTAGRLTFPEPTVTADTATPAIAR
jgi:cytochrome b pre-mRNA-processing protein 3